MQKASWKMMALVAVVVLMLAGSLQAQGWYVFGAVGSSAQFNVWGVAAYYGLDAPVHVWSGKNMGGITDTRTGVPLQKGNLWIAWSTSTNKTAFYLSVDSTVGVRAMYAAPRTTLYTDPAIGAHATDNLIGSLGVGVVEDANVPAAAVAAITGQQFTVGFSEVRPEDGKMATERTCAEYGGCPGGIGASTVGSAVSTATVRAIEFNISGTDPISGLAVPTYSTIPVGANSVLVFVNDKHNVAGGLGQRVAGAPVFQDITVPQLAGFVDGSWSYTRDINMDGSLPVVNTTTFVREPLSGTYNTFEFQVPAIQGIGSSQEKGRVTEPFNQASLGGGFRKRVIGTGEMISTVNNGGAAADYLGYAFWGLGNFSAVTANCRYLTVNGVEPIQDASNYGFFPFGWNFVTHKALKRGDYPVWGLYYAILANPADPIFVWFNNVADFVVGNYPEYADWTTLKVFKSHYNPDVVSGLPAIFPGKVPHNGIASGAPAEWGGTVAGQTYGRQTEQDYYTHTGGSELTSRLK
ncbi:MAG TPA: hypothetical protein VMW38_29490 [Terriglobia bacterium]|nr:hypothetical protein [Terriglobia bacterium]